MRITNFEFENVITFDDKINILIIEHPNKYYHYCNMIINQFKGLDGGFILSENFNELSFVKEAFVIYNLFEINEYDKRILSKLYSDLESVLNEDYFLEFNELNAQIINLLEKISFSSEFSLEFDTVLNFNSLLKMQKVDFLKEKECLLEKLIDYISIINKYLKPKLLIIFGLKTMLSDKELDEFYKFIKYHSIKLLLIESFFFKKRDDESVLIIDKDLCELTF